jgi:hypothetical protein
VGKGEGSTLGAEVGPVVGAGALDAGALVEPSVGAVVGFDPPVEDPQPARVSPTTIPIAIRPRVVARIGEVYDGGDAEGSTFLTTSWNFPV